MQNNLIILNNIIKLNSELSRRKLSMLEKAIKERKFNSEDNREEALDELEGAFVALDEIQDILDRDDELANMRQAVG